MKIPDFRKIHVSKSFSIAIILIFAAVFLGPYIIFKVHEVIGDSEFEKMEAYAEKKISIINQQIEELPIPDKNLVNCLKTFANGRVKTHPAIPGGIENVIEIESLFCNSAGIRSLEGLATLKNLRNLDFSYNEIKRLDELEKLKALKDISLAGNPLEDITVLGNIPSLKHIKLPDLPGIFCFEIQKSTASLKSNADTIDCRGKWTVAIQELMERDIGDKSVGRQTLTAEQMKLLADYRHNSKMKPFGRSPTPGNDDTTHASSEEIEERATAGNSLAKTSRGNGKNPAAAAGQQASRPGNKRPALSNAIEEVATLNQNATSLIALIKNHQFDTALHLLKNGTKPDIEAPDRYGAQPLIVLAQIDKKYSKEKRAVLSELLKNGADPNGTDESNNSALHFAISGGDIAFAQALLTSGMDIHAENRYGETAIHWAQVKGEQGIEVITLLRKAGMALDKPDNQGSTPLHKADFFVSKFLLEHGVPADTAKKSAESLPSPLVAAVQSKDINKTILLLRHGANPTALPASLKELLQQSDSEDDTLLKGLLAHYTHQKSSGDPKTLFLLERHLFKTLRQPILELFPYLVHLGVNVNCINEDDQTPLIWLSRHADDFSRTQLLAENTAKALIHQFNADTRIVDRSGKTAAYYAVRRQDSGLFWALMAKEPLDFGLKLAMEAENIRVMPSLIEKGANPSLRDSRNRTPILLLASHTYKEYDLAEKVSLLKLLLSRGADINASFPQSGTALHAVISNGNFPFVPYLLDAGINIFNKDERGESALFHLFRHADTSLAPKKKIDIIESFLQRGFAVDTTDSRGRTMLFRANEEWVIRFLVEKGANVNYLSKPVNDFGLTPLIDALQSNKREKVELLLALGADPNLTGYYVCSDPEKNSELCTRKLIPYVVARNAEMKNLILSAGGTAEGSPRGAPGVRQKDSPASLATASASSKKTPATSPEKISKIPSKKEDNHIKEKGGLLSYLTHPFFYIKVVDQDNNPVENALLKYSYGTYHPYVLFNSVTYGSESTDQKGLTSIARDKRGLYIISIAKEGYRTVRLERILAREGHYSWDNIDYSRDDSPLIIPMFKLPSGYSSKNVRSRRSNFRFMGDGREYTIDLFQPGSTKDFGHRMPNGQITAQFSATHTPDSQPSWSLKLSAINGGIARPKDIFTYVAADQGYVQQIELTDKCFDPDSFRHPTQLFIKYTDKSGKTFYGQIHIMRVRPEGDVSWEIEVEYAVNTEGERWLENTWD